MKTFRLFISSTFNDFKRERKVLQTEVYPTIKEYASSKGYTFQPIDLRWGVSNEAQLDQKTLELCLSEVRACKTHLHPNFLIMIGDRYGWVPLPYAIEVKEFEEILNYFLKNNKNFLKIQNYPIQISLLKEWYKLDLNQTPASYILKEREDIYKDYDTWAKVENVLRAILQSAVNSSNLNAEQKRKYFLSATEAEVEEGIIPYVKPTPFQEKELLSKNARLFDIDPEHIFGFFRDIDKSTQIEDKFITGDYKEAQDFKERVKATLINKNILHKKDIKQIDKDTLDKETLEKSYLQEFEARVVAFLKSQIDTQKKEESQSQLSSLEIELQAQSLFAQNKRKDFLETEPLKEMLNTIDSYIAGNTQEPLLIYGASGRGKSSLMAKAIEKAEKQQKAKKTIYRFVGATPYSGSSKEILISMFEQLGIDVKSEDEKESFEQFSQRVQDQLLSLEENITFFIDAVDQLGNEDQFLWLPRSLPKNLKIIISALDDENYKEDTKYYNTLKELSNNRVEIPAFSDPAGLLKSLLEKENRTITKEQEEYFLKQFVSASSPLYVSVVSQEIKNWKSTDKVEGTGAQELALTNKGIIKEFIINLTETYHHHEKFVQKVLGYIYASRDGLSEAELLALISSDEAFVEMMAPETWHENPTKELPMVHWSRLHTQLKPFLSSKMQDGEELMYFFHREFEDAMKELTTQREEHEAAINATQKLIEANQDKAFEENRWGKLYATLITEYELRYQDKEKQREFAKYIATIEDRDWVLEWGKRMSEVGLGHQMLNRMHNSISFGESLLLATEHLYAKDSYWVMTYVISLNDLGNSYQIQENLKKLLNCKIKALEITESHYLKEPKFFIGLYIKVLTSLAGSYFKLEKNNHAMVLQMKAYEILKPLYSKSPLVWAEDYTTVLNGLASSYSKQNDLDTAIVLEEESLKIIKTLYIQNNIQWVMHYSLALGNLAISYFRKNNLDKAIKLQEELLELIKPLYNNKPNYYSESYTLALNNLAEFYSASKNISQRTVMQLNTEAYTILKCFHIQNPNRWAEGYIRVLNNRALLFKKQDNLEEAIEMEEESLNILKDLYLQDSNRWTEQYARALNNLAVSNKKKEFLSEAIELEEESLRVLKPSFNRDPNRWIELYSVALHNLANSYNKNQNKRKALVYFKEAYQESNKILGSEHTHTIIYRNSYLSLYSLMYDTIEESKFDKTFTTLLNLAKGIASYMQMDFIEADHLYKALQFVELNEKAYTIFENLFGDEYMDALVKSSDGNELIMIAQRSPDKKYEEHFHSFIKLYEKIFADEKICRLHR